MPKHRIVYFLTALMLFHSLAYAGTLVQFRTFFGDIEVELYDQDKPVTVQNFLNYIKSGRYTNEFSHRLIPGFVIQGGGFSLTTNTISAIPTYPPIKMNLAWDGDSAMSMEPSRWPSSAATPIRQHHNGFSIWLTIHSLTLRTRIISLWSLGMS